MAKAERQIANVAAAEAAAADGGRRVSVRLKANAE